LSHEHVSFRCSTVSWVHASCQINYKWGTCWALRNSLTILNTPWLRINPLAIVIIGSSFIRRRLLQYRCARPASLEEAYRRTKIIGVEMLISYIQRRLYINCLPIPIAMPLDIWSFQCNPADSTHKWKSKCDYDKVRTPSGRHLPYNNLAVASHNWAWVTRNCLLGIVYTDVYNLYTRLASMAPTEDPMTWP
jgi:hypothetical protein